MDKKVQKQMFIVKSPCYKCKEMFNVALVNEEVGTVQIYGPEEFTKEEMRLAEEHGVLIKEQFSATRQESYYANTCPNCGVFVGQHFLFTEYFCEASYGGCEYETIDLA